MGSVMEQNLRNILKEKNTKIIPENIKEGVNIFNIEGTYSGEVPMEEFEELQDLVERLKNNTPYNPVRGDSIYLNDSADLPLKNFSIEGNTEQDSTTGKNLLPNTANSQTINGITLTINEDKSITINGTSTGVVNFNICADGELNLPAETYILSSKNTIPSSMWFTFRNNGTDVLALTNNSSGNFTLAEDSEEARVYIYINSGVTINNLIIYPMIRLASVTDDTYEPYTEGIASPNPSYPQEIENVEGKNKLMYTLQSLKTLNTTGTWNNNVYSLDGLTFTVNDDLSIKVNGSSSSSRFLVLTNSSGLSSTLTRGVKYKLNGCPFGGNVQGYSLRLYNGDVYESQIGNDLEFIFDSQGPLRINIWGGYSVSNVTFKPMISKEGGEYVPYNCIQIKKCNKNLVKEVFDKNLRISAQGSARILEVATYKTSQIVKAKPNTTYVIDGDFSTFSDRNCRVRAFNNYPQLGNVDLTTAFAYNNTRFTITTDATTQYLMIYDSQNSKNIIVSNMFVCEQQYADTYVAHQEKTYNFPLSEGQKLMQDGIIEDKVVNPQRLINLGDLEWSIRPDYSDNDYILYKADGYTKGDYKSINYCTHFPILSSNPTPPYNCIRLVNETNYGINILIQKSIASTIQELKTWFTNNNVQVQVTSKEPDETAFTQEQQDVINEIIKDGTYSEGTYYSLVTSIDTDMDVTYFRSLEYIVDNLDNRLTVQEGG